MYLITLLKVGLHNYQKKDRDQDSDTYAISFLFSFSFHFIIAVGPNYFLEIKRHVISLFQEEFVIALIRFVTVCLNQVTQYILSMHFVSLKPFVLTAYHT